MPDRWIVRLVDQGQPYGPFDEWSGAAAFAAFLTAEVDPATIERLRDPVAELLSWRASLGQQLPETVAPDPAPDPAAVALAEHRFLRHAARFGECPLGPCNLIGPTARAYAEQVAA